MPAYSSCTETDPFLTIRGCGASIQSALIAKSSLASAKLLLCQTAQMWQCFEDWSYCAAVPEVVAINNVNLIEDLKGPRLGVCHAKIIWAWGNFGRDLNDRLAGSKDKTNISVDPSRIRKHSQAQVASLSPASGPEEKKINKQTRYQATSSTQSPVVWAQAPAFGFCRTAWQDLCQLQHFH